MEGKNSYIISSGSQSESAEPEITIYEKPVYLAVKRCFDIVFSLLCIIVFTIPILFVMLYRQSGSVSYLYPIQSWQKRQGIQVL